MFRSLRKSALAVLAAGLAACLAGQPAEAAQSRTWLINGLVSAVPFVGYGFANLKTKIANATLYSYVTPIEGSAFVQPKVLREIREEVRRNPDVEINLIGISYGANIVTRMVKVLDEEGIQVSYLGVLDGLPLSSVTPNVRRVDNFVCNLPGCLRDNVRLTRGNDITIANRFAFLTSHIALANNSEVHARILNQITTMPFNVASPNLALGYAPQQ